MSRRQWSGKEKFQIVMSGLKGRSVAEICNEYGITQSQYYTWRDVLLNDGEKLFERGGGDKEKERLELQNRKLKETIGDLTVELKKTIGKATLSEISGQCSIVAKNNRPEGRAPLLGISSDLGISALPAGI